MSFFAAQAKELKKVKEGQASQAEDLKKHEERIAALEARATKFEQVLEEILKKSDLRGIFGLKKVEKRYGSCIYTEWVHVPLVHNG